MESISFVVCFIMGFAMCFISYRQGIKDGQKLKMEQTIAPIIKSPVQAIKEAKKANEEAKEPVKSAIENLLAYNGMPQKEVNNER